MPEAATGTTFADSAGVSIATATSPAWIDSDRWTVIEPPLLSIGRASGEAPYLFSRVSGAIRFEDGRIVVADRGSAELRFFGQDGAFIRSAGREGEGPGEFSSLDFVGRYGDSIVTYDERLTRIQVFSGEGAFARSIPVESPWPTAQPGRSLRMLDGRTLGVAFYEWGDAVPDGVVRWPQERVVAIDIPSGDQWHVKDVLGYEAFVRNRGDGGYSHGQYLFAKGDEFAAGGGRLAWVVTDTFRVEVTDPSGQLELVIQRPDLLAPPTSDADREAFVDAVIDAVFPESSDPDPAQVAALRSSRLETPMAPHRPLIRSMLLDAAGNLWVEPFFSFGESPHPYEVFGPKGTWFGQVALPDGLNRGSHPLQAPYLEIGLDYVLGVWTDDLGVETVRMYAIEKGGT